MLPILTNVHNEVIWLTSGILSHREGVDSFYEHMFVLACHEVNPLIVPSSDLRKSLLDVEDKICSHPRLALPDNQDVNTWAYYSIMWVSSIVMEDFLIVIPLISKSLQMDLYRVYNLPTLYCKLKVQFSYVLEGKYLAISTFGTYAPIPTTHEIHICLVI